MIPMSRTMMDGLLFTLPAGECLIMWWYTRDIYMHVCEGAHVCYLTDYTHVQCSRCNIIMILDNIHVRILYLCTYSKTTLPLGKSWTSLFYSITAALHSRCGLLDVVRYLVTEAHCDPNVKGNDGLTPLHYACQ